MEGRTGGVEKKRLSLEFIIPTYKRLDTAILGAQSIVSQLQLLPDGVDLHIRIQDDATPGLSNGEFELKTRVLPDWVVRQQNPVNLGMSANIFHLINSSSADFCTILTDDDCLQPNVLGEIAAELLELKSGNRDFAAAALFVPRYSYLEDGSLLCVACNLGDLDQAISPSPLSAMRYAENGFILTGLFLVPKKVNFVLWNKYLSNAFFPVIYFGALLQSHVVAYRNRNWFSHTVCNVCHWESWGSTGKLQQARLCRDYLEAISITRNRSLRASPLRLWPKIGVLSFRWYRSQINGYSQYLDLRSMLSCVPEHLYVQPDFLIAFVPFLCRSGISIWSNRMNRRSWQNG